MATVTRTTDEMVEALSASCLPCELQAAQQDVDLSAPEEWAKWEGIITYEGQMTGDGRILEKESLRWDTLPIPLRWAPEDNGAHAGAVVVGRITEIERRDDGAIFARGDIDLESDQGKEAARQIKKGLTPGVSIDLDDVSFETRVRSETQIDGDPANIDEDGRVKMMAMNADDEITITTAGRIRAATLVAIPAFEPARLAMMASAITITAWSSLTAAFNPEQARVPKGNGRFSGRWIDMPGTLLSELLARIGGDPVVDSTLEDVQRRASEIQISDKEWSSRIRDLLDGLDDAADQAQANGADDSVVDDISNTRNELSDYQDIDWWSDPEFDPEDPDYDALSPEGDADDDEDLEAIADGDGEDEATGGAPEGWERDEEGNLIFSSDPSIGISEVYGGYAVTDESGNVIEGTGGPHETEADAIAAAEKVSKGDGGDNVDSMPEGDDVADPVGELKTSVVSTLQDFDDWVGSNGGNDSAQRVYKNIRSFIQSALTEIEKGDRDSLGKANGKIAAAARVAGESGGWSGLDEGGWYDRLTDLLSSVNRTIDSVQASAFDNDPDTNWVEETGTGHLPNYIRRIADHLIAQGKSESAAIASAVNTVKRWARGGSVRADGGPNVKPDTVAKAAAALAEWEAKKAQAKASSTLDPVTAGGFPLQPPRAWFSDPGLTEPTPLKVSKDGRVYGHLATWGTCHTGYPGQCVTPPTSRSGYAFFRTGAVFTSDGSEIPTGVITMDTLHAGKNLSGPATLAHYENTGRAVADIVAGEDAFGIWVAGALRPEVTDEQARALRGSPLSGDWRRYGNGLELVAALAVNVPGFPIPRTEGLAAGGAMKTLVAAGMLVPEREIEEEKDLSDDDMQYLKQMASRERQRALSEVEELARRVEVLDLSKRVGV